MTTLGLWHYPINPSAQIPNFNDKPQFKMTASEIENLNKSRITGDDIRVSEEVAFKLAAKSPNPAKAEHAVHLLAAQNELKALPLAALLFSCAEPSRRK